MATQSDRPTKIDRLFAMKAVIKRLEAEEKQLEAECKGELLERYREDGTDRMRAPMFGAKAGTLSVVVKEGAPAHEESRFQVVDPQAVIDWMDEARPDTDCFAQDNLAQFAEYHFNRTGECPDGCTFLTYTVDAVEDKVTAQLRVKEDVVVDSLVERGGNVFWTVNRLLLGDGEDE